MKKYIVTAILLLIVRSFQLSAQTSLADTISIYKETFKTGSNPVATNQTIYKPEGVTSLYKFVSVQTQSGEYNITRNSGNATVAYPNSWISIFDHTRMVEGETGTNYNYMMIVNGKGVANDSIISQVVPNVCSNTTLLVRIYAANLVGQDISGKADPNLNFIVRDLNTGEVLVNKSQVIPRKVNYGGSATDAKTEKAWVEFSATFTVTHPVGSLLMSLYNKTANTDGNDFALDDFEVCKILPKVKTSGQVSYCANSPLNITTNYDVTYQGFGSNYKIQWIYSDTKDKNIALWTPVSTGTVCAETVSTGYYRAVIGNADNVDVGNYGCCSVSDSIYVQVISSLMYWKLNAVDQNWNNPANWVMADGTATPTPPGECTDVHIPGNANIFPSLDLTSPQNSVDKPATCRDIWFHFGAEVAKPNLLQYRRAYVQYNFGKSTHTTPTGTSNEDKLPFGSNGVCSATPLQRGRWYALAAPLKKVASGDFCVGGYPNFWQQSFKSSPNQTSGAMDMDGSWYTPVSTNTWDLGNQHNAISIWAGEYLPGVIGESKHDSLDHLKGIIEVPYFQNDSLSRMHRLHEYRNGTSYFYYYNYKLESLPKTSTTPGSIQRGEEAYRFIFEGVDFDDVNKEYLLRNVPANSDVMIGNPFVSSLDFNKFYERNQEASVAISDGYYLYTGNTFTQTYSYVAGSPASGRYIAPLQAFFIHTGGTAGEKLTLHFPVNTASVARSFGGVNQHQLRVSSNSSVTMASDRKDDVIYLQAENEEGTSWVTISMQDSPGHKLGFISSKDYPGVPQIYALDRAGTKNSLLFEGGYVDEVPVGISMKKQGPVKLTVFNTEKMQVNSLILRDNYTGEEIDLLSGVDSYSFVNMPGRTGNRFTLLPGQYIPASTGLDPVDGNASVSVRMDGQRLYIQAKVALSLVQIANMQGVKVFSQQLKDEYSLNKEISLPGGFYVVTVKLADGEIVNKKVIVGR